MNDLETVSRLDVAAQLQTFYDDITLRFGSAENVPEEDGYFVISIYRPPGSIDLVATATEYPPSFKESREIYELLGEDVITKLRYQEKLFNIPMISEGRSSHPTDIAKSIIELIGSVFATGTDWCEGEDISKNLLQNFLTTGLEELSTNPYICVEVTVSFEGGGFFITAVIQELSEVLEKDSDEPITVKGNAGVIMIPILSLT